MDSPTLLTEQQAMGGVLVDGASSAPPTYIFCRPAILHFGDARVEYDAATTGEVLFDVSDRVQIEVTGKDARSFLHNFCTNDIKRLAASRGCEAFVTNVKGRILAHMFVFATEQSLWIETAPRDEQSLLDHFERYLFYEDVQFHGRTEEYGELFLSGPTCQNGLAKACPAAEGLEMLQQVVGVLAEHAVVVRRIDLMGPPGYLLSVRRTGLEDVWRELVRGGVSAAGAEVFHACRIAAGFPLYGLDLTQDNLAQEAARTQQAISFTKGCYLGQEPIARIDALGHVNRQLCRVRIASEIVPEPGTSVTDLNAQAIGVVTSAARIPGTIESVALACLRTSHIQPTTRVTVLSEAGPLLAQVW
ncbi:MAG: CAF17-like 4Fe-4S cluster assembly/insertion protein YgfZ [Pirellulaceae bacterium]